ncbi:MAG TPA: hypothetical protein ENH20_01500 [Candidatus Pacearchaeota archaeon]|nr:hypothetical protein [Candidatus Pacearchaeota archaeon]
MNKEIKEKIILDLCGGTGAWSKPYLEAGYSVRNITLPDYDVRTYNPPKNVYGILVAPPCTMFSLARTKAKKPRDLKEGMEIVRACLNIIWSCMEIRQDTRKKTLPLKFWALENPNGMLKYFLGKPAFEFDPWQFGDEYKKKTYLWGWFNEPKKKFERIEVVMTKGQIEKHKTNSQKLPVFNPYKSLNPKLQKKFDRLASREIAPEMFGKLSRQERRAITPAGFAKAFFEANR